MPKIKPKTIIFGELDATHHIMIAGSFYHVTNIYVGTDAPYAIVMFYNDVDETSVRMRAHLQTEIVVYVE